MKLVHSSQYECLNLADFLGKNPRVLSILKGIRLERQADELLSKTNEFLNSTNEEHRDIVRSVRQKIYDRRKKLRREAISRNLKFSEGQVESAEILFCDHKREEGNSQEREIPSKTFWIGLQNTVKSISGEDFAKNFPCVIFLGLVVMLFTVFLVDQTIPLYLNSGYDKPIVVSITAALMVLGFTVVAAVKQKFVYYVFLTLAIGYEGLFIIICTIDEEKSTYKSEGMKDPEVMHAKELANQALIEYKLKKKRFDMPSSSVYKNDWYWKKHLKPAIANYNKTKEEYISLVKGKEEIREPALIIPLTAWMKLILRIGVVVLNSLLTHLLLVKFMSSFRTRNQPQTYNLKRSYNTV